MIRPVDIVNKVVECLNGKVLPLHFPKHLVDAAGPLRYPVALAGGSGWFLSSTFIMIPDKNDVKLLGMVQ